MFALALIAATLVGPPEPSPTPPGALPTTTPKTWRRESLEMGTFFAGDLLTTELFLARGYREGNPIYRDRGLRIGGHVLLAVVEGWTLHELAEGTPAQRTFGTWIKRLHFVFRGLAIAWNLWRAREECVGPNCAP